MSKTTWTYEDEKISCQFFLKYKDKSYQHIDRLMKLLNEKFPIGSVRLKLKNYEFLYTKGSNGLGNYSFLSKFVYQQLTTKGGKKGLSNAACGKHTADVANDSVRNILTLLSVYLGDITTKQMIDTSDFFNYECPYTGRDLSKAIHNKLNGIPDSSIAIDHIVPQNQQHCGLNVYGNLVWVDSKANGRKSGKNYKEFLLTDEIIAKHTTPVQIQARIDKIEAFQRHSGYDPVNIAKTISPMLKEHYDNIQQLQINMATKIAKTTKL